MCVGGGGESGVEGRSQLYLPYGRAGVHVLCTQMEEGEGEHAHDMLSPAQNSSSPYLFSEIPHPSITIKHTFVFAMGT